ncbi:hypothetical protein CUMW_229440 [Citrus unshiu]|uniref:Branched-chain-amino-acid aminotransferase-like protein 1 n=1 Tax=Citrus unshiu TaxID=55188 RepID=A0A2H5QH13_CITUN|nr:hypothetical protein CUMW_229440 [Citrus unshiu]
MAEQEIEVIHSWSAPRSLSTSLMYSFAQRDDMEVLDEPLYPAFLRVTGFDRPYGEEILSKIESDGNKVVKEVIFGPGAKKYRYCKMHTFDCLLLIFLLYDGNFLYFWLMHMAKQRLPGLPDDLMKKGKHIILIRNPLDILPSFDKVVPPSFKELGLADLVTIYSELCELGKSPVIVDAADLQQDPEVPFPMSLYDLLEQSLPFYNMLRRNVRKTSSLLKSPLPEPDLPVPANKNLLAWVGDEIVPRDDAKVSVFDSIVQGGDGVWEGLRVYNGKVFKLEEHLDRLVKGKQKFGKVKQAIFRTLIRNVLPEWKTPVYDNTHGVNLVTATTRRNSPNNLDSKIHHNNLLNNILAKIEGNNANAGDAIMLDKDGYVSETNATNIFLVKKGRVLTPHADYCLPGITRATVMELVVKENLVLEERRISLSEFHTADEVVKIDGRIVGDGKVGPVTQRIQKVYKKETEESGVPIPSY